jgi:hypothetical protein
MLPGMADVGFTLRTLRRALSSLRSFVSLKDRTLNGDEFHL